VLRITGERLILVGIRKRPDRASRHRPPRPTLLGRITHKISIALKKSHQLVVGKVSR
jgi:hypothetical protein